jgi:hypothetical protein
MLFHCVYQLVAQPQKAMIWRYNQRSEKPSIPVAL